MQLLMTPKAYWHLQWLCHRTPDEVSSMGILCPKSETLTIIDVVLVKQEVSRAHVDLDMEWWADKQIDLYERQGIEPWQTSTWIHTHPAGITQPSVTDNNTMRVSFGSWNFAIMLILTKCGQFYARTDFQHSFPGGAETRFSMPCQVVVDWSQTEAVTDDLLKQWEKEFLNLVVETGSQRKRSNKTRSQKANGKSAREQYEKPWFEQETLFEGKEEPEYVELCQQHDLDPYDPTSYEAIYGYWP